MSSSSSSSPSSNKSFLQAFLLKYSDDEEMTLGGENDKFVFVGKDKFLQHIIKHKTLRTIGLENEEIKTIFSNNDSEDDKLKSQEEIVQTIPEVTELDLSNNLLSNFFDIVKLVLSLPKLKEINLRANKLSPSPETEWNKNFNSNKENSENHKRLKELIISDMNLTWEQCLIFASHFPDLTNLYCCTSQIKDLNFTSNFVIENNLTPKDFLTNLQFLSLDYNLISDWEELNPISQFPKLETLYLNGNPLKNIHKKKKENNDNYFSSLKVLSVMKTEIDSWDTIDVINSFESLTHINLTDCPLYKPSYRQCVIALCPKITILNSSPITAKERKDSEQWFLLNFEKFPFFKEEFVVERVKVLRVLWNISESDPDSADSKTSGAMQSYLIEIEFRPVAISICEKAPQKKKIPSTLPLAALQMLCSRLYSLPIEKLVLKHLAPNCPVAEDIDYSAPDVAKCMIGNGSIILIDEKR